MIKGINASYKGPLPHEDLVKISSLAGDKDQICIRAAVDTIEQALAIKEACSHYPLIKLMYLVEKPNHDLVTQLATHVLEDHDAIELLNEPNLSGISVFDCESFTLDSYGTLKANGFKGDILAGCIWNLKPESLDYLFESGVLVWPEDIIISYHRYPVRQDATDLTQNGNTRLEEFNTFKRLIVNRKTACTEFGFHFETIRPYWFWPFITRPAIDEATAANETKHEFNYHKLFNDEYAIFYQYTDGPDNKGINRFGIKKTDGTYRLTEKAIREA